MRFALALLAASACSFEHGGAVGANGDGGTGTSDAPPPGPLHLAPPDGLPGTMPLVLVDSVVIDTSGTPMIDVQLPAGDTIDVRPQLGGGPDLAVLHVGALSVETGAVVRVTGTRPLVIVAGGAVDIAGVVDASAQGTVPGPGGAMPGAGSQPGSAGRHLGVYTDSGGGGGGFGAGGAGGGGVTITGCALAGGNGGMMYGDEPLAKLEGGSGGGHGSGSVCDANAGGGGGGALQISSLVHISIVSGGSLLAGGGGGSGGGDCGSIDANSGAGGGSGGAIVLQAPMLANAGVVAANGGGGGGSGTGFGGSGGRGQDGQPSTTAANGGNGTGTAGANGGGGAASSAGAVPGTGVDCGNNGGGGGGGIGRIAVSTGYADSGVTSPAPYPMLPL